MRVRVRSVGGARRDDQMEDPVEGARIRGGQRHLVDLIRAEASRAVGDSAFVGWPAETTHSLDDSWPAVAGRGAGQRDPRRRAAPYRQYVPVPARGAGPCHNHGRPCEGVFAWVTANYLMDTIRAESAKTSMPYAVLDLGSASTQIVFGDGPQLLHLYTWSYEPVESAS